MTKKSLSITQMIIEFVTAVALFMPGVYVAEWWKPDTMTGKYGITVPVHTLAWSENGNFFLMGYADYALYIGIIALAFLLIAAIGSLMINNGKESGFTKFSNIAPLIALIFIVISLVDTVGGFEEGGSETSGYFSFEFGWLIYIIIALQIVATVFGFMLKKKKFAEPVKAAAPAAAPAAVPAGAAPVSEADELAKFKKLLDDGVITQEEFDAKKKQILGL